MEVSKYNLAIWEFDNRAVRYYMALHYILGMLEYCRNTEYGNMAKQEYGKQGNMVIGIYGKYGNMAKQEYGQFGDREIWENRNMANMGKWQEWQEMGIGQYGSMGIWPLAADGSISEASLSRQPVCHQGNTYISPTNQCCCKQKEE